MNAVIFPGQGSQFEGMGKDFYDKYKQAREVFDSADDIMGRKISKLCFEGPEDELRNTLNSQPAILTMTYAVFCAALEESGNSVNAVFSAGHSLGEYSAYLCFGAMGFEEALRLVSKRAELMSQSPKGGMTAVIGMEKRELEMAIKEAEKYGVIQVSNLNTPSQIVVGGEIPALEYFEKTASSKQGIRCVRLNVSGPFHTVLMEQAGGHFAEETAKCDFRKPSVPVVSNVTALPVEIPGDIGSSLVKQITSPVRWAESVEYMKSRGADRFIEVGPGKALSGLVKKICPDAEICNIGDAETLTRNLKFLKN